MADNKNLPHVREDGSNQEENAAAAFARADRASILSAYNEARGNKSRVAEILGISRKTLYARLKRLNLELP